MFGFKRKRNVIFTNKKRYVFASRFQPIAFSELALRLHTSDLHADAENRNYSLHSPMFTACDSSGTIKMTLCNFYFFHLYYVLVSTPYIILNSYLKSMIDCVSLRGC